MTPQEIVQQKRAAVAQAATDSAVQQRQIDAVTSAAAQVSAVVAREAAVSRQTVQPVAVTNDNLATSQDIQGVIEGIGELTQLSASELSSLSTVIAQALLQIAAHHTDTATQTVEIIRQTGTDMTGNLASLEAVNRQGTEAIVQALHSLLTALDKPEKEIPAPIVTVEPPQVTVQERKLDLSPIAAAIAELKSAEEAPTIDLDDYRVQDLVDSGKTKQYIGFMNPSGGWYIIENDIQKNQMRYLFGTEDYAGHFQNAALYEYHLLNEAINAAL